MNNSFYVFRDINRIILFNECIFGTPPDFEMSACPE